MKTRQKAKTSPKNNKHPYSCAHFQFHLNDQDPQTIKAKLQLQQLSSALDNYDQKQSSSHLRLFTMHNQAQKKQSWKSSTQKKLFQSQNLDKHRQKKLPLSSNSFAQQYRKKKNLKQRSGQNFCSNKEIKLNLSFNNIEPNEEISQIKLNQINKIIKKQRPMSQKKDNMKKFMNFQVEKVPDGRIHSHANLNIVQKLKSNFLSTSIYQFSQQKINKQYKKQNIQKKGRTYHHRASSEPLSIIKNNNLIRQNQNLNKKKEFALQVCPEFSVQNYLSCNLKKSQQQNHIKVSKDKKARKVQVCHLFNEDSQLKQDFEQLKRILRVQNQNVLSGKFHRNILTTKYSKRQYNRHKVQIRSRLQDN